MVDIDIDYIAGNCPVQAEGTINGASFYFRSRGDVWYLEIYDLEKNIIWEHLEFYGQWPDAGWITEEEARDFIQTAASRYAAGEPGARLEDNHSRWKDRENQTMKLLKKYGLSLPTSQQDISENP